MSDVDQDTDGVLKGDSKTPGAPGAVVVAEDPAAPSKDVSSKRQSLSDLFTIVRPLHAREDLAVGCANHYVADPVGCIVLLWLCSHQRWISE